MRAESVQKIMLRGLGFSALWWVLAEGLPGSWTLGVIAVLLATGTSLILSPLTPGGVSLLALFRFMVFFVRNSLRGGIQVAAMALRGRSALRPALVDVPTMLPPGGQRILLVNALGLMPGTLVVESVDEVLRFHLLDERLPVVAEVRALEAVIAKLERRARC